MKAVICGAGIAGLSAAKFLADKGWEITLVEKARGPRSGSYMIDFFGSGYEAAERSGLLAALAAKKGNFEEIFFIDETGKHKAHARYSTLQASFKNRLFSIMRGDMESVLLQAVSGKVSIEYGQGIESVKQLGDSVEIELTDGNLVQADLLIGADGIHSHTRKLVFGPEEKFLRYLGLHTAAVIIDDKKIAKELNGTVLMLSVPKRQVGLYPVGEGKVAAFFAHHDDRRELFDDPALALRKTYGDLGWLVPKILDHVDQADDIYYDWMAQIDMAHWHKGRVVLLGDACYAVSLLAGQGASLAMAGAYLLAQKIGDGDIELGLKQFQDQMQPHVRQKQIAGRRTAKWFVPSSPFYEWVRNLSMNMVAMPLFSALMGKFFATSERSIFEDEK